MSANISMDEWDDSFQDSVYGEEDNNSQKEKDNPWGYMMLDDNLDSEENSQYPSYMDLKFNEPLQRNVEIQPGRERSKTVGMERDESAYDYMDIPKDGAGEPYLQEGIRLKQKSLSTLKRGPGISKSIFTIKSRNPYSTMHQLCKASVSELSFIRVDGVLYCKYGTYFSRMDEQSLAKRLFEALPEKYKRLLYQTNFHKLHENLLTTNLIEDYSMTELNSWYSDYIALENGYFDIVSGELLPPESDIVCLVGLNAIYISEEPYTQSFDGFLQSISAGDISLIERIEDFMALVLATGKSIKKFFVLGTAPDSGKSTIANLLDSLFPSEYVGRTDINDLGKPFSLASVVGNYLNISMDLTEEVLSQKSVGNVKILTGERRIQVEKKFSQSTVATCTCKLVFGTNFPIRLKTMDKAFFNRMEIIPFNVTIPVQYQDHQLLNDLLDEKDAIVTKLLQRLTILQKQNFELMGCLRAEQMKEEWESGSQDVIECFVNECCNVTNNISDYIICNELYDAFKSYIYNEKQSICQCNVFTRKVRALTNADCRQKNNLIRINGYEQPLRVIYGIRFR